MSDSRSRRFVDDLDIIELLTEGLPEPFEVLLAKLGAFRLLLLGEPYGFMFMGEFVDSLYQFIHCCVFTPLPEQILFYFDINLWALSRSLPSANNRFGLLALIRPGAENDSNKTEQTPFYIKEGSPQS
jgi:hypothetical protein